MKKRFMSGFPAVLLVLIMTGCPADPELEPDKYSSISPPAAIRGEAAVNSIAVSWSEVTGAAGYCIYAGTSQDDLLKKGDAAGLSYTITDLTADTTYYIAVSSVNSGGEGDKSTVIPVKTEDSSSSTKYNKELLGEWLRIDTGDRWYISSKTITVNGTVSSKTVSLVKQSDRVIKATEGGQEYYLFGFRIPNGKFTGRIVSLEGPSPSARAISGLGGINVIISNLDKTVTQSKPTDSAGRYTAEDIIPGDEYEVAPEGGTPTIVSPQFDGDDIGTITVTSGANIKVSIEPAVSGLDMTDLYVNETYRFNLVVKNTGGTDWTAATYEIDFGNAVTASPRTGILETIEPGKTRAIPVTLKYGAIRQIYAVEKIGIIISDPIAQRSWEDSVSLKIHKGTADFNIRAEKNISGILISPDAKGYHFKSTFEEISVPLSEEDYWMIFTGATADTETRYSFGIDTAAPGLSGFTDTGNYEPNNTEGTATAVTAKQIISYLHKNDIDFFRINLTGLGNITITPPPSLTDETISGFPAAPFTISKAQSGSIPSTHTIEIAEGYTSYMWYVDDIKLGNSGRSLTLNALNYSLGKHTLTIEVYKNGVPYSKELIFTVVHESGLGNITITPPPSLTDETISGFPTAPFTISKAQSGSIPSTHTIEIAEGYTSYMWYVDDIKLGNSGRSLTLNALNYSLGKHTLTAEVYKNGVPYSKELIFTIIQ